jgi:hypothetical protein
MLSFSSTGGQKDKERRRRIARIPLFLQIAPENNCQ